MRHIKRDTPRSLPAKVNGTGYTGTRTVKPQPFNPARGRDAGAAMRQQYGRSVKL